MKVAIVVDNNPNPIHSLKTEHGLCIYFEADNYKWLMDVGASDLYYTNAQKMGIEIEDVDFLVLSHGHFDHTGGLEHFISVNKKAKIIVSSHIEGKEFFSFRLNSRRNISTNYSVVEQNSNRFTFINANTNITNSIGLICEIPHQYPVPKGNKVLFQADSNGEKPDEFNHEIVLAINTSDGLIVFSGCSHNGILNILEASSLFMNNQTVKACIGGTHLVDSDCNNENESDVEITEIANQIKSLYPNMKLLSGHCTGTNAQNTLNEILGEHYFHFYSNLTIDI